MNYAVCCVPVAPMRITPDHRTEMVSQLLFGEYCMIQEDNKDGWVKIIGKADGYEGWLQRSHIKESSADAYHVVNTHFSVDWVTEIEYNTQPMFISMGSVIDVKNTSNQFKGNAWDVTKASADEATIRSIAFKYLNTTYLWGGRSVFGIDCSGFAQAVYKFLNIPLLRDAKLQATRGEVIGFLAEVRCGDLAFFDDEAGEIVHVGILLNENEIIHSAGKVRVDRIDSQGILNVDTGLRTHQLRVIKRYI
jgi:cell wall-associated NlpC family hydrolase